MRSAEAGAYGSNRRLRPRFRRRSNLNVGYGGENEHAGKDFHFQLLSGEIAAKKRSREAGPEGCYGTSRSWKGKATVQFPLSHLEWTEPNEERIHLQQVPCHSDSLCVVAFVLESVPALSSSKAAAQAFYAFEALMSCIFLVEYLARLWTCVEARRYRMMSPWRARLHYVWTMRALVDLVSCLPFFVELGGGELPTLTWLKAFRIFRILKSERYTQAFSSVYRVVWYNSEILGVALFIGLLLMMTTSTLLWYMAPQARWR